MNRHVLSVATLSTGEEIEKADVCFTVPYGEKQYDARLEHETLEVLALKGILQGMGRIGTFAVIHRVELPGPDLPLFVWPKAITLETRTSSPANIEMDVAVVTQSVVYEHRGLLRVARDGGMGQWSMVDYTTRPPLQSMEEYLRGSACD